MFIHSMSDIHRRQNRRHCNPNRFHGQKSSRANAPAKTKRTNLGRVHHLNIELTIFQKAFRLKDCRLGVHLFVMENRLKNIANVRQSEAEDKRRLPGIREDNRLGGDPIAFVNILSISLTRDSKW